MKKIYSFVLMAMMLLIGTSAWAGNFSGKNRAQLQAAINEVKGGDTTLVLQENITLDGPIWVGTKKLTDTPKSITLNLNGHTIEMEKSNAAGYMFVLTHGELKVLNENEAQTPAYITLKGGNESSQIFSVYGSYLSSRWNADGSEATATNTRVSGNFAHLEIGTNVNIIAAANCLGTGIALDAIADDPSSPAQIAARLATGESDGTKRPIEYHTTIVKIWDQSKGKYAERGFAYGARADVFGNIQINGKDGINPSTNKGYKAYGIKTNGHLASPMTKTVDSHQSPVANGKQPETGKTIAYVTNYDNYAHALDTIDAPFVYVHKGSNLETNNASPRSAAVYASGYAKWYVSGSCEGNIGLSVSSGQIDLDGAEVKSTAETYTAPTSEGGVSGSGTAVVVNSRDAYAGDINVTVSGDTEVSAEAGYAIQEIVNTSVNPTTQQAETKVESITINGGTFQGGEDPVTHEAQPAIIVSTAANDNSEVVVYGGNVTGALVVEGNETVNVLDDKVASTAHTTTVIVDGNPVTVISEGAAPIVANSVIGAATDASIKWQNNSVTTETLTANKTLSELEINENYNQILIIGDPTNADESKQKVTLKVGRIVLGEKAQIIVNPGSKLIVNGDQGFVAPKASNFVLKTQEGNSAIFVFHPDVNSNRHPMATVEFISKSYVGASSYASQRFGVPVYSKMEDIDAVDPADETVKVRTRFYTFDYSNNSWLSLGGINGYTPAVDKSTLANAFAYYQMYNYVENPGTKVIMKGDLIGNEIPTLNILGNSWYGFANSCMGRMSIPELLDMIPNSVDKAIYLYDITADHATWEPMTKLDEEEGMIQPMQPFLIRNTMSAANIDIDYADAVYYPTTGETKPGAAPARRRVMSNITKAKIIVTGEGCKDRLTVAEDAEFSAEFDNGYDAAKFMNDGINMYVTAGEKMAIFATDNLDNTYVGFQTVNGGTYTIEFANVRGEELTLIDHETSARVAMVEGNAYEFTAAANTVNDYRFEIVESAKLPTAIDNTEAVKSIKGIYTITGQYLGEMNVWNTLPAGVYVVNGEKRVK